MTTNSFDEECDAALKSPEAYKRKLMARRLYARCYARFRLNLAMFDDRKSSEHLIQALQALRDAGFLWKEIEAFQIGERNLLENGAKVVLE